MNHKAPVAQAGQEEIDPEELMKMAMAEDPCDDRLKSVIKDDNTLGGMPAWVIRSYNNDTLYVNQKTKKQEDNYGVVVIKSLQWPGAHSFFNNGRVHQIYCGDSLKKENEGITYYPIKPPVMMSDKVEKATYDEPNPTEAWLKKKAEADARVAAAAQKQEGE